MWFLTLCHPRSVWFDFRHPFVVLCWINALLACWSRYINLLVVACRGVAERLVVLFMRPISCKRHFYFVFDLYFCSNFSHLFRSTCFTVCGCFCLPESHFLAMIHEDIFSFLLPPQTGYFTFLAGATVFCALGWCWNKIIVISISFERAIFYVLCLSSTCFLVHNQINFVIRI